MNSIRLGQLPTSRKILVTGLLAVVAAGYGLGTVNILLTHQRADGKRGMTVADLKAAFAEPRFAVMVRGPMATHAKEDGPALIDWAMRGGSREEYTRTIQTLIRQRRCNTVDCHGTFNPQRSLESYGSIKPLLEPGLPTKKLGDLSHAHLFGIGMIVTLLGFVFSFTGASGRWKGGLVGVAFVCLFCDIGSWWAAKFISPAFVYVMAAAGIGMAACVATMTLGSLLSTWRPRRADDP